MMKEDSLQQRKSRCVTKPGAMAVVIKSRALAVDSEVVRGRKGSCDFEQNFDEVWIYAILCARDLNRSVSRGIASTLAGLDNEAATRNLEEQLNMAIEPDSFEESKPDHFNIGYIEGNIGYIEGGGMQVVSESRYLGAESMQLGYVSSETQPINSEDFDDMVVLHNDTLTTSSMPMLDEKGGEPSFDEAEPNSVSRDGRNESVLDTEGPINGGQAHKEEGLDTIDSWCCKPRRHFST
ncbi:hypothetical protein GOP47_0023875 [Adiantum capillus-veneris]|uniref:Uncharacterized protein n=1 Tax=Adiantum capillus-veneris TaxID=13818 RepID=A0A9D4U4T9_ADICA|nr:hypothetical protein GOP47_0023875 [Adiantum capillus-veneris]